MSEIVVVHEAPPVSRVKLEKHLAELSEYIIPPLAGRVDISQYAGKLAASANLFYVIEGKNIVGSCAIYLNSNFGYISSIGLLPKYQGAGVGRLLLSRSLSAAANKGLTEVQLQVFKDNWRAIAFYQRYGFGIADRGGDWVRMIYKL